VEFYQGGIMSEIITNVSWLAVVVGAVVAFLLGWLWYSPALFGKKWAAGNGIEMGSASSMPVVAMVAQIVGLFLMSWFVGVTAVESKLLTFILATLAFGVLNFSGSQFAKKPAVVGYIDFGYWLAAAVVMFICQAIF
jgi:hypothetical protein